jgi:hypothetical protein
MDITIRNKLEKLKVYKKIARREITWTQLLIWQLNL